MESSQVLSKHQCSGLPITPSQVCPPISPPPTMIQPIAQLRQPYIVTLTSQVTNDLYYRLINFNPTPTQVTLTSTRKPSHGKRNSVPDDIPIRLAVTFAPSR